MRIDPRELDPFLRLMSENRPCPACGSERVTVSEVPEKAGRVLRALCADCGRTYDAPRSRD